ncbi:biosynthetic peptidoglycan transglycosylase [Saccharospirillum sp.]|uniref:biosynthetic peptidoglycan transglycosylase n=1 Tax=Saccharospirillum sp. TaxID=2033801 RepID=UPI0034A05296
MIVYRSSLLDTHETSRLIFYKFVSRNIGLQLTENTEYIIYRAKLAVYETNRLKVSTKNIKRFLVFIEDKDFHNHAGISYKSIARSILGVLGIKSRSGGSTIVQQLTRTLFITDLRKTKRRKFIELALAPWMTNVFSKDLILDIYISSVRYERQRFGIVEAMDHFWGEIVSSPTNAQAFFLIERVSNIRSKLLVNKIIETVRHAKDKGLLSTDDIKSLVDLYIEAVENGKITADQSELLELSRGVHA